MNKFIWIRSWTWWLNSYCMLYIDLHRCGWRYQADQSCSVLFYGFEIWQQFIHPHISPLLLFHIVISSHRFLEGQLRFTSKGNLVVNHVFRWGIPNKYPCILCLSISSMGRMVLSKILFFVHIYWMAYCPESNVKYKRKACMQHGTTCICWLMKSNWILTSKIHRYFFYEQKIFCFWMLSRLLSCIFPFTAGARSEMFWIIQTLWNASKWQTMVQYHLFYFPLS